MAEGMGICLAMMCIAGSVFCESSTSGEDKWEKKLNEIKLMVSVLDSKMATVEEKLNHLNVLDYAFKMNTIDNQMRSLNARMDQIFTNVDFIKEAVKGIQVPTCAKSTDSQEDERARNPSFPGQQGAIPSETAQKLDDYGKKLLQSHHDLSEAGHQQKAALNVLTDVVRSGFSKVITKLDLALELEGRMSSVTSILHQLVARTTGISDNIAHFSSEWPQVQSMLSTSSSQLNVLSKNLSNISRKSDEVAYPVSDLTRAVELGNDLEVEIAKFASVDQKIEKATALSKRLLSDKVELSPEFYTEAKNLNSLLDEIENISLPLFLSVPYLFQNLQALVGDALTTISNKSQCASSQVIQLEIKRLRDVMTVADKRDPDVLCQHDIVDCVSMIQVALRKNEERFVNADLREIMAQISKMLARRKDQLETGMPAEESRDMLASLLG